MLRPGKLDTLKYCCSLSGILCIAQKGPPSEIKSTDSARSVEKRKGFVTESQELSGIDTIVLQFLVGSLAVGSELVAFKSQCMGSFRTWSVAVEAAL